MCSKISGWWENQLSKYRRVDFFDTIPKLMRRWASRKWLHTGGKSERYRCGGLIVKKEAKVSYCYIICSLCWHREHHTLCGIGAFLPIACLYINDSLECLFRKEWLVWTVSYEEWRQDCWSTLHMVVLIWIDLNWFKLYLWGKIGISTWYPIDWVHRDAFLSTWCTCMRDSGLERSWVWIDHTCRLSFVFSTCDYVKFWIHWSEGEFLPSRVV